MLSVPHSQEPWVRWDSGRRALSPGPRPPSARQAPLRCQGPELWAPDLRGHRRPKHRHGPCASPTREAPPCQSCSRREAALDKGVHFSPRSRLGTAPCLGAQHAQPYGPDPPSPRPGIPDVPALQGPRRGGSASPQPLSRRRKRR